MCPKPKDRKAIAIDLLEIINMMVFDTIISRDVCLCPLLY